MKRSCQNERLGLVVLPPEENERHWSVEPRRTEIGSLSFPTDQGLPGSTSRERDFTVLRSVSNVCPHELLTRFRETEERTGFKGRPVISLSLVDLDQNSEGSTSQ